MKSFFEKERECSLAFESLGKCFHLWTPENFEIIFTCDDDFRVGMSIMGIAAKLFPDVKIITFELMSNHLHITAACCSEERLREFFGLIKKMLVKFVCSEDRSMDWNGFTAGIRDIKTLEDMRNVIAYDNRNGFVVSPDHTPFTYPWGANRYYFNPDARALADILSCGMAVRDMRRIARSHMADSVKGILTYEGCALPTSFCDIDSGEKLFRDRSHYFSKVSRNIEASAVIAKEIGESIFYNDDELYSAMLRIARTQFNAASPSSATAAAKIEMARTMRFEYNASEKQIVRILKIQPEVLSSLGL